MKTVAEMLDDRATLEDSIADMLDHHFPSAMIERAIAECLACTSGQVQQMEAALMQIVPRFYGFLKQIDPSMEALPPIRLQIFTWKLVSVFLRKVHDRVPPGGGGRRVAA